MENSAELKAILARLFSTRNRADWFTALDARGVMVAVVKTYDEVLREPDESTASWIMDGTAPSGEPVKLVAAPFRIGGTAGELRSSPPPLGAHSAAVLRELGYGDDEIGSLLASRVIAGADNGFASAVSGVQGG